MDFLKPIYTEKADCQDCYKCVRTCPVKAIKIVNGSAMVIYENCILCGSCVEVCPAGAKKVREDIGKVKHLLSLKNKVIVSLAPSYKSEFKDVEPRILVSALKKLGFFGVSETALGAQEVSANCAELLSKNQGRLFISSACPTVVEYVKKYFPQLSENVTDFYSPLIAHCKLLRMEYGDDIGTVLIGPCISKKKESDSFPGMLDVAITFDDLKKWLNFEGISLFNIKPGENSEFIPERAEEGSLYPVDGGMIAGIKANMPVLSSEFMTFSGINNIKNALDGIEKTRLSGNLFLELLACEGGCVNGPKTSEKYSTALKRLNILDNVVLNTIRIPRKSKIQIETNYDILPVEKNIYSEAHIREVLYDIGKNGIKDELNCAGCGYNTCRDFALSLLDGKSEKTMCVTYMRQLAQKKANALIKTMPSGIVIVDDKLKIVESNKNFAKLIGEETEMLFEVKPGLEGALLQRVIPFYKLFQNVLETGEDIIGKEINYNNAILLFSIFTIEKHKYVGGIFRDITEPWVRKEQIINKAKQVIKKNLSTVQKIAYLLGENASETEVTLNSIIESFSTDKIDDFDESIK
jgi:iron only hydrogenase large subunit-like protein